MWHARFNWRDTRNEQVGACPRRRTLMENTYVRTRRPSSIPVAPPPTHPGKLRICAPPPRARRGSRVWAVGVARQDPGFVRYSRLFAAVFLGRCAPHFCISLSQRWPPDRSGRGNRKHSIFSAPYSVLDIQHSVFDIRYSFSQQTHPHWVPVQCVSFPFCPEPPLAFEMHRRWRSQRSRCLTSIGSGLEGDHRPLVSRRLELHASAPIRACSWSLRGMLVVVSMSALSARCPGTWCMCADPPDTTCVMTRITIERPLFRTSRTDPDSITIPPHWGLYRRRFGRWRLSNGSTVFYSRPESEREVRGACILIHVRYGTYMHHASCVASSALIN